MVPTDPADDPGAAADSGGLSRRVPRRLTFDSEPVTIHDLLAQDSDMAGSGPRIESPGRSAAGRVASEPPSRARRWASFMAPVAVVAAGLASLPAAPPGGAHRAMAAGMTAGSAIAAPQVPVAEAAAAPSGPAAPGMAVAAAAAVVPQGGAAVPEAAASHARLLPASPVGPAVPDAVAMRPAALPSNGALPDVQAAPGPADSAAADAAARTDRPTRGGQAAIQRSAVLSGPGEPRPGAPAPVAGARSTRAGAGRAVLEPSEPAAFRNGLQRPVRLARGVSGGLTLVQARQCGHLGTLPRGFCEQRVQLTYCTGRYGRSGDCPLPAIAMPN